MVHTPARAAGWSPAASQPGAEGRLQPFRRDAPPAPYPGPDDPGHQLQGGLRRVPDGELDLGRLLPRRDHSRGALPCHRPLGPEGRRPRPPASGRPAGRIFSGSGMAQPMAAGPLVNRRKSPVDIGGGGEDRLPAQQRGDLPGQVVGAPQVAGEDGDSEPAPARPPPPRRGPGPYSPDGGPPAAHRDAGRPHKDQGLRPAEGLGGPLRAPTLAGSPGAGGAGGPPAPAPPPARAASATSAGVKAIQLQLS